MLDNLQGFAQSERMDQDLVISQLRGMRTGGMFTIALSFHADDIRRVDILTFFTHPQNAAIVLTKRENCTLCESFEVSPGSDAVEETARCLVCSYPWSAVDSEHVVWQ